MAVLGRVALPALVAYVVTGLVYAAGMTFFANAMVEWPFFSPRPWTSAWTFVGWFVGQAVAWPGHLFPIRGLWEIAVPAVFLATLWLYNEVARAWSARVKAW